MEKLKQPMPFDELVNDQTRAIHSALLEGGGKSMKAAVHWAMVSAFEWRKSYDAYDAQQKKGKK